MPFGWVAAAVGVISAVVSHQDAKKSQAQAQGAINNQQAQGEDALKMQQAALDQQKTASEAALAAQKDADQKRIDQANASMVQQKAEFDTQFKGAQDNAAAQLAAQKEAASQQFTAAQSAADAQKSAMAAQASAADQMYKQQTESINRANQKQPDTASITAANVQAGKTGQSGTMLTGAAGVDMSSLLLGKNTLLGA